MATNKITKAFLDEFTNVAKEVWGGVEEHAGKRENSQGEWHYIYMPEKVGNFGVVHKNGTFEVVHAEDGEPTGDTYEDMRDALQTALDRTKEE